MTYLVSYSTRDQHEQAAFDPPPTIWYDACPRWAEAWTSLDVEKAQRLMSQVLDEVNESLEEEDRVPTHWVYSHEERESNGAREHWTWTLVHTENPDEVVACIVVHKLWVQD